MHLPLAANSYTGNVSVVNRRQIQSEYLYVLPQSIQQVNGNDIQILEKVVPRLALRYSKITVVMVVVMDNGMNSNVRDIVMD